MNYAEFRTRSKDKGATIRKAVALMRDRVPLPIEYEEHNEFGGTLWIKPGCPFTIYYTEKGIEMASVATTGLARSVHTRGADARWGKYYSSAGCIDAYTYLIALFKACLCRAARCVVHDDGIGKYREDPDDAMFESLMAWRERPGVTYGGGNMALAAYARVDRFFSLLQDRRAFPELFPQRRKVRR